jgi:hypothetical protein
MSPVSGPDMGKFLWLIMHIGGGWQGGTGWHETRHPRATPCFITFLRQSDHASTPASASQQVGHRAGSPAFLYISPHSRGFAHIGAQTGGGNAHERVPPPYFIDDFAFVSLRGGDSAPELLGSEEIRVGESGCYPHSKSPQREDRQ